MSERGAIGRALVALKAVDRVPPQGKPEELAIAAAKMRREREARQRMHEDQGFDAIEARWKALNDVCEFSGDVGARARYVRAGWIKAIAANTAALQCESVDAYLSGKSPFVDEAGLVDAAVADAVCEVVE
jgi:hypothetical protein